MPTEKPRITIVVDEGLLNEIDNFWHEYKYSSRSAAAVNLLRIGLETLKKETESKGDGANMSEETRLNQ